MRAAGSLIAAAVALGTAGIVRADGSIEVDRLAAVDASAAQPWVAPAVEARSPVDPQAGSSGVPDEPAERRPGSVDNVAGDAAAATAGAERARARPLGPRGDAGTVGRAGRALGQPGAASGVGSGVTREIPRTALALGGVVALILIFAGAVKRFGRGAGGGSRGWSIAAMLGPAGRAPSGVMSVLARYPVARGQTLVLLQVDRRVLLLSHTHPSLRLRGGHGGFTTLAEFNDPVEVASIIAKAGGGDDRAGHAAFAAAIEVHDRAFEAIEPWRGHDAAPDPNRVVHHGPDGDRAEIWNDRAVLRPSPDGRAWIASGQGEFAENQEPVRAGRIGRSGVESAPVASGRNVGDVERGGEAMTAIRDRLAGLRGRGVM